VLLDTAAHELTTKRYSETSIGELADLLDVSKPALCYYVKNKEDILLQCTIESPSRRCAIKQPNSSVTSCKRIPSYREVAMSATRNRLAAFEKVHLTASYPVCICSNIAA